MSEAIQFQTNWVQALANTYDACERQPGLIGRIDIRQVVKDDKVYEFAFVTLKCVATSTMPSHAG